MEPGVRWFKVADGGPFQFECGHRGIHVPGLAAKVQLKARPLELNGVVVGFNEDGYISLEEAASIIGNVLGQFADNPIPVSGQPAGGGVSAPAASTNVEAGAAGLEVQIRTLLEGIEGTFGKFTEVLIERFRKLLLSPEVVSVNPSSVGSTKLQQVLLKLHKRLMRGFCFAVPTSNDPPSINAFGWSHGGSRENERAGYTAAMAWITNHLCPPGVCAVLKDNVYWLASEPADDVRINNGNVDVVFCLEEDASTVARADDLAVHLLNLCGQCELKTVRNLQTNTNKCFAQACIKHIAATYLQDAYLAIQATENDVGLQSQVKFVTILTDLNDGWYVMKSSPSHLEVWENYPPRPANQAYRQMTDQMYHKAAAVLHIKQALAKAADSIKLVKAELFPGTIAALPPRGPASEGGGNCSSSGSGSNGTNGGGDEHAGPSSHAAQPASGCEPSNKSRKLDDGTRERQCPPYNKEAMLQAGIAFKERLLHDSDMQRDMEAGFNLAMVEFLRTPPGYKGLLGLDSPPSTIQLPSFFELLSGPKRDYAARVAATMQATQGDDDGSQG